VFGADAAVVGAALLHLGSGVLKSGADTVERHNPPVFRVVPPDQIFELPVVGAGLLHEDFAIFSEERRRQHIQALGAYALGIPDRGHCITLQIEVYHSLCLIILILVYFFIESWPLGLVRSIKRI